MSVSSLGTGYANPTHKLDPFNSIVPPIQQKKPFPKQLRIVLNSVDAREVVGSAPLTNSYYFTNVTIPDGVIQGQAVLKVESFQCYGLNEGPELGYLKINSPSFPMIFSYDSGSGADTTTLVTFPGFSYQRSADDFVIVLRESMFMMSKSIRIDLVASDSATYSEEGNLWVMILTICET